MLRYTKVVVENYRSQEKSIRKTPLHPRLLLDISIRARWKKERNIDNLDQGEFYLSETEYEKFGLKKSQKGQINRAISKFINAKFIEKVEGKTGTMGGFVYRLLTGCPFQPSFQNEEQNKEGTGSRQGTSRDERSKKYENKKITEMNFEEQVQAYHPERHDEFIVAIGKDETRTVKKAWFKQFK